MKRTLALRRGRRADSKWIGRGACGFLNGPTLAALAGCQRHEGPGSNAPPAVRLTAAPASDPFQNRPTGLRSHDLDPALRQGPVVVFGFPTHLLQKASVEVGTGVHGMARLRADWLRPHQSMTGKVGGAAE